MDRKRSGKKLTVGEEDVADVVAVWTKIPVSRLTEKESGRLLKLESTLHKRVVGQDEAVTAVAKAIIRNVQSVLSCSLVRPVSARPSFPKHWQRPFSEVKTP